MSANGAGGARWMEHVTMVLAPECQVPPPITRPREMHPLPEGVDAYCVYPFAAEELVASSASPVSSRSVAQMQDRRATYLATRKVTQEREAQERMRRLAPGWVPDQMLEPTPAHSKGLREGWGASLASDAPPPAVAESKGPLAAPAEEPPAERPPAPTPLSAAPLDTPAAHVNVPGREPPDPSPTSEPTNEPPPTAAPEFHTQPTPPPPASDPAPEPVDRPEAPTPLAASAHNEPTPSRKQSTDDDELDRLAADMNNL